MMIKYYKKAADKNNIEAIKKLATVYGEKKDEKSMLLYYDKAIELKKYYFSINVLIYYYDQDDGIYNNNFNKNKNILKKYCNIYIDNYDYDEYTKDDEDLIDENQWIFNPKFVI